MLLRRAFSGFVAVVSDIDSLCAVLLERRAVFLGKAVHSVNRGHVAIARAPEGQRIDQRFAEDDVFRDREPRFVPHPAMRSWQVQVIGCSGAQIRCDLAPIHLHHLAAQIEDRNHHGAVEVLVSALAVDAELLQASAQRCTSSTVRGRQTVADGAIGKAQPEGLDHLRRFQAPILQILQRFGTLLQALLVVAHHLQQQHAIIGTAFDRRGQFGHCGSLHTWPRVAAPQRQVFPQKLDRMAEADTLGQHDPVDDGSSSAARSQTVPKIFPWRNHQRRLVIVVEGTQPDQVRAVAFQFHPAPLRQPLHRDFPLQPLDLALRDPCHRHLLPLVFRGFGKKLSRLFRKLFGFRNLDGRYTIVVYTVKEF